MNEYEMSVKFIFEAKVVVKADNRKDAIAKVERDVSMTAGVISSALGSDLVSHKVKSYPEKVLEHIKEVKQ